jgi:hypothetical protein
MKYITKREVQTKFWYKEFKIRDYMGLDIGGWTVECEFAYWSELTHYKIR